MEADLGKARASEERLKGAGDEVVAINGCPNLGSEDQPVFLPESVERLPLLERESRAGFWVESGKGGGISASPLNDDTTYSMLSGSLRT